VGGSWQAKKKRKKGQIKIIRFEFQTKDSKGSKKKIGLLRKEAARGYNWVKYFYRRSKTNY